jgi:hypothetical protein
VHTRREPIRPFPWVGQMDDNGMVTRKRPETRPARRWLGLGLGVALLGAAVGTELRKPARERTWHGLIAGRVPYDLRRPTLARVHERLWNKRDRRILVPTVFGVGWTVNLRQLLNRTNGATLSD